MKTKNKAAVLVGLLGFAFLSAQWCSEAQSAEKKTAAPVAAAASPVPSPAPESTGAEEVQVQQIKQKYWAGGDEAQVGVVQNRAYSKARKFNLGVGVGTIFNDPFLSNKTLAFNLGYNFSEYFAVEMLYWKIAASGSSANTKLEEGGKIANTNLARSYYGAEALWSILYGKLSFLGKKIIYYDMHFSAGAGVTNTESGNNLTGTVGLGQRFYISTITSLRLDYRLTGYKERILEKEVPSLRGTERGTRMNYSHTIVIGLDFMLGSGGK